MYSLQMNYVKTQMTTHFIVTYIDELIFYPEMNIRAKHLQGFNDS